MNLHPRQRFREMQSIPVISYDGYIRLRLSSLDTLSFVHLISAIDDGLLRELQSQTLPALRAGYSEWVSDTVPPVSVGWDWFIHRESERIMLAPDGVRSNVMLIDQSGYDLGSETSTRLFGTWLSSFEWQPMVSEVLNNHASSC